MIKKQITITFCLLFLLACKHENQFTKINDTRKNITLADLGNFKLAGNHPQIIKSSFIFLENNKKSFVLKFDKIFYKGQRFYLFDKQVSKTLFIFSANGHFLLKINSFGNQYGKYIQPTDFDVDSHGNIWIWDVNLEKFIVFKQDGAVKEEISVNHRFLDFSFIDDNHILLSRIIENNVTACGVYNLTEKKLTKLFNSNIVTDNISFPFFSQFSLYHSNGQTMLYKRFSKGIYTIDDSGVNKEFNIISDDIPPMTFLNKNMHNVSEISSNNDYIWDIVDIYQTRDYQFFKILKGWVPTNLLISKGDRRQMLFYELPADVPGQMDVAGIKDDQFYSVVHPNYPSKAVYDQNIAKSNYPTEIKKKLIQLDSLSNPVIELFNFKF
jgi:hypothetical protein